MFRGVTTILALTLAILCQPPASAQAQSVEAFYRGKTVTVVIGYGVGGSDDLWGRLVARYMGRHIPGQPLVVAQTVWKDMGFCALIYYAALMSIDPELIEAATMDGAKAWHKIRDLILPHLAPVIGVVFMLTLQGSLHTFDSAFLMSNGRTAEKVTTLAVYAYQKGLLQFDLGMASACGVVLLGLCVTVACVSRWILPPQARF